MFPFKKTLIRKASYLGLCFLTLGLVSCASSHTSKVCSVNAQCDIGYRCAKDTLFCEEGCDTNADCPSDKGCHAGKCEPKICELDKRQDCFQGDSNIKFGTTSQCKKGYQICIHAGTAWTDCYNQVLPSKEICDGKDNDCNGQVDEVKSCKCHPGLIRKCSTNPTSLIEGTICRGGFQTCTKDGKWGACEAQITPLLDGKYDEDTCFSRDANCDGKLDYNPKCACKLGETRPCLPLIKGQVPLEKLKSCQSKSKDCKDPQSPACKSSFLTCLGLKGLCKAGIQTCLEICDGVDSSENCEKDKERVKEGKSKIARYEYRWSLCTDYKLPVPEETADKGPCNGKDDDCDGRIDNVAGTDKPITFPCFEDNNKKGCDFDSETHSWTCKGECKPGVRSCYDHGTTFKTACSNIGSKAEECNGKDDDCDGEIDESEDLKARPCYTGKDGCTKNNKGDYDCVGACRFGSSFCSNGKWGSCQNEVLPVKEDSTALCIDTIDNDCDGKIDSLDNDCKCTPGDKRDCYSAKEGCRDAGNGSYICKGACTAGKQTCDGSGQWSKCKDEVTPNANEFCGNNLDDDCDGTPDEDEGSCKCNPGDINKCYHADDKTKGVGECLEGSQTCTGPKRTWGPCEKQVTPTTEICKNNKDDNCDGKIDENCP